jgi:hypothetical protein
VGQISELLLRIVVGKHARGRKPPNYSGNWETMLSSWAKSVMSGGQLKDEGLPQINTIPVDCAPLDTKRWVARRKAMIVNAVHSGAVSLEEVCRCYELSVEEFVTWQRAIETHGVAGLRVTRVQIYRDAPPARRSGGSERQQLVLTGRR